MTAPQGINSAIKARDLASVGKRLAQIEKRLPGAISAAIGYEVSSLAGEIRRGIRSQAPGGKRFAPLAESTIRMKKSSKALINHGDLLRSVHHEQIERAKHSVSYFVGVKRGSKGRDGQELANIAEYHEFGTDPYKIPITAKLRAFWMAMYRKGLFAAPLSAKRTFIDHPGLKARPFLVPSFEKWASGAEQRIVDRAKRMLRLA